MKLKTAIVTLITTAVLALSSCGVPKNTVYKASDLEGKTVGVQDGTTGMAFAQEKIKDVKLEKYATGADAVKDLTEGKLDAVIFDKEPALQLVADNENIRILDDPFASEEYAFAVSKNNSELLEKVNTALSQIRAEGTLKKITEHWIGSHKDQVSYTAAVNIDRSNGTLKVATDPELEPYSFKKGDLVVGIDIDLMQAVADKLGMTLEIEILPFHDVIDEVVSGKADIIASCLSITEERKEKLLFTNSYATGVQVIIVRTK